MGNDAATTMGNVGDVSLENEEVGFLREGAGLGCLSGHPHTEGHFRAPGGVNSGYTKEGEVYSLMRT